MLSKIERKLNTIRYDYKNPEPSLKKVGTGDLLYTYEGSLVGKIDKELPNITAAEMYYLSNPMEFTKDTRPANEYVKNSIAY